MASDIFRNIIEQKIDVFASTFGNDANKLFKKDSKLIHPLEYGMYRERCAKELLSFICDRSMAISDGFMISSENHVSTQCDIIMYQRDTMSIIDNGTGISEEDLVKVQNKFYKGTSKKSGTGLGLSIATEIVQLHQGKLWIESTEGEGTQITIMLPLMYTVPLEE